MAKKRLPRYLGPARKWRASMRRRLRNVARAVNEASLGCAHTPDGGYNVKRMKSYVRSAIQACSRKNWGV